MSTVPHDFPPDQEIALAGWQLVWSSLHPTGEGGEELAGLRERKVAEARTRYADVAVAELEVVAAMRALFRAAGTDPTRYRPSSEALLRRVLKGDDLPAIHPMVDLNNLLSLELLIPCCVIDPRAVEPPFRLRRGEEGESMASLRGAFSLTDHPVLEDARGPVGTPLTDSERVMIRPETEEVWLVAYLPTEVEALSEQTVQGTLEMLLEAAPVARM
jgi:DNA/RNA-binding domain of Phe-tRNA-synthetase-like protein